MAFEFLSNLDTTTLFLLLIIFILFVISMKRVFSIVMNGIWIAVASVLFPIVMNRLFGFDIPTDADSLISFLLLGLGMYFVYLVGKSVHKILGLTERIAKKTMPKREKSKEEKKERGEEQDNKKEERRQKEKELEEREMELRKKEQEIQWKSAIHESKKRHDWTKEYASLEEPKTKAEKEKPKADAKERPAIIEPLPIIEHREKKKKKARRAKS